MKKTVVVWASIFVVALTGTANGDLWTLATDCQEARNTLSELIKKPGAGVAEAIEESMGVYILASCTGPKGKVICFQCVDRNQELRTVQLLHDSTTMRFRLRGYGCACRDRE